MKKLLIAAAMTLVLASCEAPQPPKSVQEAPNSAAPAAADKSLPKGIALSVPYVVIGDDWVEDGENRKRKTVIEFEQADAASVGRTVTGSMLEARYRLTGSSPARGGERFNFRADEGVRVSILVRPRGAVKLTNSKATGNLEVSYTEPRQAQVPAKTAQ